jgi:beta-lactamase regulating signal transducer with metallopeptidase domain
LANPAARALVLGAAAGLGLAAFRVKTTSVRLFTWTTVLYAALAVPWLGWMLPPMPIPTPAFLQYALKSVRETQIFARSNEITVGHSATFPAAANLDRNSLLSAAERRQNAAHGASRGATIDTDKPQRGESSAPTRISKPAPAEVQASSSASLPPSTTPPAFPLSIQWSVVAAGIYLAVALIFFARFFIGLAYSRRLVQTSQTIADPHLTRTLASRARVSGFTFIPHAAESDLISVPVTLGAMRSTILLPVGWREWDDAKLDAVLAHELSHVARRDALTQRLSLLHRAIFWFSPLAWFLDRRLADLAEQASDEAALSSGTDRKHYARILLDFFEALHTAPGRIWWQGVSMAKAGQAEERVERILAWKGAVAMRLKKSIAVVVVALAIPVVYLAASAYPTQHVAIPAMQPAQDQTPPPAQPPAPKAQPAITPDPVAAPTPDETMPEPASPAEPTPAPAPAGGIRGGVSGPAPVAPVSPIGAPIDPPNPALAPLAPIAPAARVYQSNAQDNLRRAQAMAEDARRYATSGSSYGRGYSYSYGYDDDQRFVIVSGKSDSLTMSGSTEDAHHVEKLRKSIPGDFIWFQIDEKSYIIRDQATIDRARKLWAPQDELGKKQEELGKRQEALGKQQEELGARMEQIHVKVPDMTAELDKLKAELKALGSNATMDQVGQIQSEMGELQSKLGEIQSHAGDQQGKLGEEMGALGEKQSKLGEQQGELGRQQAKLAQEASRQMKQLLDEAIKKGTAQPEL